MEGISQSEMLTRWIDARWEAMGYTDADLEAYETSQRAASSSSQSKPAAQERSSQGAAAASSSATSNAKVEAPRASG